MGGDRCQGGGLGYLVEDGWVAGRTIDGWLVGGGLSVPPKIQTVSCRAQDFSTVHTCSL